MLKRMIGAKCSYNREGVNNNCLEVLPEYFSLVLCPVRKGYD